MPLETITRRSFSQPDRAEVQERVAQQVERDPQRFLALYAADPRSFGGRYVNSDLMKETFAEYRESPEARNRYNAVVHNAAAVLAAEQYRRAIANNSDPSRDTAVFLTGIPGRENNIRSPRRRSPALCPSYLRRPACQSRARTSQSRASVGRRPSPTNLRRTHSVGKSA